MNFLKNKTFWVMLFIVTLGTILRLIFINKAEGLWNDEYVSWQIASIPLGKSFLKAVASQCHMPFYYLYLKFFIHFFGSSDLLLRLTSLLAGVLSIFVMYFAGKEFKNGGLGILCASIAALSSFLIYFSQEVRLYEILFLFSALSLLFTLRLGKEKNVSNLVLFVLSSFLIMFTHTIGFIFVLFNLIFLSLWVMKSDDKYKKPLKSAWGVLLIFLLVLAPFIFKIFTTHSFSQWWGHFTISKLGFLITDYFSPVLTNLVSAPDNFFYSFNLTFIFFAILPSAIALVGLIKALKSKRFDVLGLFYISLLTVIVLAAVAITGKLVFLTKYSIEIYPILILLAGFGLVEIENKHWRRGLIFLFCSLNLFYILSNPNSAPKMHRAEGHKIVADLIKHAELKKGDMILLIYYNKEKFEKYMSFKKYRIVSMNKANFPRYISDSPYEEVFKNGKELYKGVFLAPENEIFNKEFKSEILDELKPNQKVTVIILNTVSVYSPVQMQKIAENEKNYKATPLLFLVFSYLKNQTLKNGLNNLQIGQIEQIGSWSAITFHKT